MPANYKFICNRRKRTDSAGKASVELRITLTRSRAFATRAAKFIDQKINYIHQNPVRSGIVQHPEDYCKRS